MVGFHTRLTESRRPVEMHHTAAILEWKASASSRRAFVIPKEPNWPLANAGSAAEVTSPLLVIGGTAQSAIKAEQQDSRLDKKCEDKKKKKKIAQSHGQDKIVGSGCKCPTYTFVLNHVRSFLLTYSPQ